MTTVKDLAIGQQFIFTFEGAVWTVKHRNTTASGEPIIVIQNNRHRTWVLTPANSHFHKPVIVRA